MPDLSNLLDLIAGYLGKVLAKGWIAIWKDDGTIQTLRNILLFLLALAYIAGSIGVIQITMGIEKALAKNKRKNKKKEKNEEDSRSLKDVLDISFIDRSSGHEFEYILGIIFKDLGYDVEVTGQPNLNNNGYIKGDYGVDLILIDPRRKKKIVVQAKRWRKPVDARAIQQIYSGKDFYDADEAWVITNSVFTKQTKEMARKLGVRLIDRQRLKSLIEKWLNSRDDSKNLVDNNVKHSSKPVIQMT